MIAKCKAFVCMWWHVLTNVFDETHSPQIIGEITSDEVVLIGCACGLVWFETSSFQTSGIREMLKQKDSL